MSWSFEGSPTLNSDKIDWRITSIQDCINEYLAGLEKGDSDNEVIEVVIEVIFASSDPCEGLRMLDQLVFVTGICKEDRRALFSKDGNPFHSI